MVNYPDGRASQFSSTEPRWTSSCSTRSRQCSLAQLVDNKRLSAVLEQVKAQQAAYPARQQRGHIARQRPPNNLETPGLPTKARPPRRTAAAAPV